MKHVLVMGINSQIGQAFFKLCQQEKNDQLQFNFIEEEKDIPANELQKVQGIALQNAQQLAPLLQRTDILVINVTGWDIDYILDAVMDAIETHNIQLEKIVFRSVAGVNDEYPLEEIKAVTHDQDEFIKQQQYAGKLVDESEIPYTILRPTNMRNSDQLSYQLIEEGKTMKDAQDVSVDAIAQVLSKAISGNQFKNQSIGICG
ncbi:NAD(P)H-binding protein [Pediococcus ethanolidurans]|uniref:NADH(P)-binding n=1 Tax=Pediococcus ethanolidurans TaxID=319653 RepID=A0A0R2K695_9LACO|nr:NAD(P)H-binding protein [Pediococcus ethanolidurans]KRN81748.1 hypothetical protein IV87_GL000956 [Pediococcus ethanolidurans]GEN95713.1 NAD-dependent dehydratase [Pediococcus ethanolidurans]SER82945.1 NADH(P)-binding [Pediococcus ethanolidurans]